MKKAATKPKPRVPSLGSARRVSIKVQARRSPQAAQHQASQHQASQHQAIGSMVGAPAHLSDVSGLGIRYSPEKGVVSFAQEVARATPTEAMQIERAGVPGRYIKDLAKQLGLAATRVFTIIDVPRATAENKASKNAFVTGHSGQAALTLTRLIALANEIVANSTAREAEGFDTAKWLGAWIERPQPALGGQKPADILDTPTGADVVTRLLGAVASGAYQ